MEDVHFDAVEHVDAGHLRAHRLDLGPLLRHVVDGERARGPGALGVIGNRKVRVAELARRLHHARGGVAPVAPRRVRVQVAANVGQRHQLRQPVALDGVELAAVFAQFGRNVRQIQAGVDRVLGRRLDAGTGAVQPAVAEDEAPGLGAGAQRRGVPAAAGVPQQRRARIGRRREVERQRSLLGAERDRRVGAPQHAYGGAELREAVEHLAVLLLGSHRQHGDVADLGREAAQAAERDERGNGQTGALHVLRNRSGQGVGATEGEAGEHQGEIDSRPSRKTASMRGAAAVATPPQRGDGKEGPCGCLMQCADGAGTGPASLRSQEPAAIQGKASATGQSGYKVFISNDLQSGCGGVVCPATGHWSRFPDAACASARPGATLRQRPESLPVTPTSTARHRLSGP